MKLVGTNLLDDFKAEHADMHAHSWIDTWVALTRSTVWKTPHDVKNQYPSIDFLGHGLTIFDVKGNNYRLEVTINYTHQLITVDWIGTHAEYDKRDKKRKK